MINAYVAKNGFLIRAAESLIEADYDPKVGVSAKSIEFDQLAKRHVESGRFSVSQASAGCLRQAKACFGKNRRSSTQLPKARR